ncbi:hypothetical protein M885DRAFT_510505 [Pelagophyceae sp. CCMP2097]|nr:hypothetical protein M885DRAFT_510505 [Pelagophyceae sp. CCMP2097]
MLLRRARALLRGAAIPASVRRGAGAGAAALSRSSSSAPRSSMRTPSFQRLVLHEKLSFFYPFGNTAPTNVLVNNATDVLLLASGDLRSPLYSLTRQANNRKPAKFTVNDSDVHVMARNVVILYLAHHAKRAEHVFQVWFSLGLSHDANADLVAALKALTGEGALDALAQVGATFRTAEDWRQVSTVLQNWKLWDMFHLQSAQAQRSVVLDDEYRASLPATFDGISMATIFENHATSALLTLTLQDADFPCDNAKAEIVQYLASGVVEPLECTSEWYEATGHEVAATPKVNPTLFKKPGSFDVHYGSNPFLAFPLCSSSYDSSRPLANHCNDELATWVDELRMRKGKVEWILTLGDCTALCSQLEQTYDLVSTSNVADHVGLLPVLQAARLVTKAGGVLLTATLLHLSHGRDVQAYLREQCLQLPPELWPGVLGWRCLGFEGSLAPTSSLVQFVLPDMFQLYMNSAERHAGDGPADEKVRSEANFAWECAPSSNLPLQLDDDYFRDYFRHMLETCRLAKVNALGGVAPGTRPKSGIHTLHLHTLLVPLLVLGLGAERVLQPEDTEMLDILLHLAGAKQLVVGRLPLCDDAVRVDSEPQPHLAVVLYDEDGHSKTYSNLWLETDPEEDRLDRPGERSVCFFADPAALEGLSRAALVGSNTVLDEYEVQDVFSNELDGDLFTDALAFKRLKPRPPQQCKAGRIERLDEWHVPILFSTEWAQALKQGEKMSFSRTSYRSIKVGILGRSATYIDLAFPGPVQKKDGIRMVMDLDGGNVTVLVKKGVYDFEDRVLTDEFSLDDSRCWQDFDFAPEFLNMVTGMQLTNEEEVAAASKNEKKVALEAPLVEVKGTVAYLFQQPDDAWIQIATVDDRGNVGVHALVIHHGMRREHRTGTPAADISICFLSPENLTDVVPWWEWVTTAKAAPGQGAVEPKTMQCSREEFALLQDFVQLLSARANDAATCKAPPMQETRAANQNLSKGCQGRRGETRGASKDDPRRGTVPEELRHHFTRFLCPPLIPQSMDLPQQNSHSPFQPQQSPFRPRGIGPG